MKKLNILWMTCLFILAGLLPLQAQKTDGYVVVASGAVKADAGWAAVVKALAARHKAAVLYYDQALVEVEESLRHLSPRYVAVVEKPEFLNREFVMEAHRLSRRMDEDIYADYIWGIVTGYTAADAMQLVERSAKPYVVHTALNTTCELGDGRHFSRFAYMSDGGEPGGWGEKKSSEAEVETHRINKWEILNCWVEKYKELDPDLLVTSSHATERNLEMPFSTGNLKPSGGRLYADFMTPEFLEGTAHPRVYFAAGNCLIGNIDNNPGSMAVAWLSGMDATAMVGYVVTTWYGRNGWGGLKYWAANAGRLTLAQAIYMNQQDMLHTEWSWNPEILKVEYPFSTDIFGEKDAFARNFERQIGQKPTRDQMGFVHDRNVLVYYGDPAWEVMMSPAAPLGYRVDVRVKKNQCVVTVHTDSHFDAVQMHGGKLKQEHVADIPFALYFPQRLKHPVLAPGQSWKAEVTDDFLLLYDADFQKNSTYTITLDINH